LGIRGFRLRLFFKLRILGLNEACSSFSESNDMVQDSFIFSASQEGFATTLLSS
jgi:hypothetical protein